jgi:sec-independent protein translocase protein TatC
MAALDTGLGAPTDPAETGQLTWLEHLVELRRRMLVCLAAVAVGAAIAWFGYDHIVAFMVAPYRRYLHHHPHQNIAMGNLVTIGPLEGFTTRIKVCGYAGIVLAAPVWIWQAWRFIAPGLYKKERRYTAMFVVAAVALFTAGAATAVLVFPKAITWMISVSGTGVAPLFSPSRYFGLYAMACVVFGVVFTYPVFLIALQLAGIVSSAQLRRGRRIAIVICLAVAAVITPSSDPFSFLAMAVPMVVFYEISIITGRLLHR